MNGSVPFKTWIGTALLAGSGSLPAAQPPNVILFYIDDLGFDEIGLYDPHAFPTYTRAVLDGVVSPAIPDTRHYAADTLMYTPAIDALTADGVRLDRAYVTSPVCTPSRYSLLTSRYATKGSQNFQSLTRESAGPVNVRWTPPILPEETTLPKLFKAGGYTTGMVGKWHNGLQDVPSVDLSGLDENSPAVMAQVYAYQEECKRSLRRYYGFDYAAAVYSGNPPAILMPAGLKQRASKHNMEYLTHGALEFIDAFHEDPFFLYFSTTAPHGFWDEGIFGDNPEVTYFGERVPGEFADVQPSRADAKARALAAGVSEPRNAAATWLDDSVAAVVQKLDEYGLRDDTIIVFLSDHQSRGKYALYEGAHIPGIITWPGGIPEGQVYTNLFANIDVGPTLAGLCGLNTPDWWHPDGMDLSASLQSQGGAPVRESLLLEIGYARAVIQDDWKFIAVRIPAEQEQSLRDAGKWGVHSWDGGVSSLELADGSTVESARYYSAYYFPHYYETNQLYDLQTDPLEQTNRIHDAACADRLTGMETLLREALRDHAFPFAEFRTVDEIEAKQ